MVDGRQLDGGDYLIMVVGRAGKGVAGEVHIARVSHGEGQLFQVRQEKYRQPQIDQAGGQDIVPCGGREGTGQGDALRGKMQYLVCSAWSSGRSTRSRISLNSSESQPISSSHMRV
jgi:hypothetical protein